MAGRFYAQISIFGLDLCGRGLIRLKPMPRTAHILTDANTATGSLGSIPRRGLFVDIAQSIGSDVLTLSGFAKCVLPGPKTQGNCRTATGTRCQIEGESLRLATQNGAARRCKFSNRRKNERSPDLTLSAANVFLALRWFVLSNA